MRWCSLRPSTMFFPLGGGGGGAFSFFIFSKVESFPLKYPRETPSTIFSLVSYPPSLSQMHSLHSANAILRSDI